ncbi:MAG TPA: alpha/beta hydrolase-fold protein [Abditibacterium sp.]
MAFKREQIALIEAEVPLALDPQPYLDALEKAQKVADQIERARGDASNTPFNFHERAYFAPDGSAQPFWIALPKSYSARRKYPLIVFLHGYSPAISKINAPIPAAEILEAARARGFIVAMPYGRRNSDFVQWGQDDVLRVKSEMLRLYSVDAARVFLAGTSMGGYGAYAVGLHDPGQWNALAPISARSDFYEWFKTRRDQLPAWKRLLFDADDPRFLARNARQTPIFTQHGALDIVVPVEHSRFFAADAKKLNLPFRYLEQAKGDHNYAFQHDAIIRTFDWFKSRPAKSASSRVELVAADLREAKNGWAQIEAFENYNRSATLSAQISDGKITVSAANVARFTLEPPSRLLKPGRLYSLVVNGVEAPKLFDPLQSIQWQKEGAKTEKSPTRTGPFKNALRDPFLLVYGDDRDQKAAQRFALEWRDSADGTAQLKAASEVSDADKAAFNLILFGTRASNPLIGEIADRLPLELTPQGYRVGEKSIAGEGFGLRMVWKSPWSAQRLIGVCSGIWWGEKLPVNHKWDLIPDYILFNSKTEADDTNTPLEAGFFDGNWELKSAD